MNDHSQSLEIASRLRDSVQKLHDMAHSVAEARQIKEFAAERRRNLLHKFMYKHNGYKVSHSQAEMLARTDPEFLTEFNDLESQHKHAEQVVAEWQAEMCRYDGLRSLLSYSKQVFESLQG